MHFLRIDTRFFGCEPSSLAVIPTQVSATGYPVRAMLNVIFFLLSDFPSSEFSVPAFRNALFHLRLNKKRPMTMEDTMFRNVGTENSEAGKSQNEIIQKFRTRQKFEIKKNIILAAEKGCCTLTHTNTALLVP